MISIKKHMDDWSVAQRIQQAYQSLMDRFLETALDRIPAKDASAARALRGAVAAANGKLKAAGDAEALERVGVELLETLAGGWDDAAAYFVERERGLTEIISLLARTAGKLDASNRNFYSNLYQSVEALEKVGSIDDISALRKALGEHLHRIEDMVSAQEQVSAQGFQALQTTLESAKTKAETISRLVTAAPLTSLPSRRSSLSATYWPAAEFSRWESSRSSAWLRSRAATAKRRPPRFYEVSRRSCARRCRQSCIFTTGGKRCLWLDL